jgi:glycerol-3-phosphate acyltransferase PlsY
VNTFAASVLLGYLFGSIPAAVWVGRLVGRIDIRRQGSGNAGATNVARVLGVKWGILVGLVDILKGFLPVSLLSAIAGREFGISAANAGLAIGIAAILGHVFPLFAGFKGGKGVLTALGVFAALLPFEAACAAAIWATVFAAWRIVSLGSIVAVLSFAGLVAVRRYALGTPHPASLVIASLLIAALVLITHRENIGRLLRGEEKRFSTKR